jgi:hypothetical protein
VNKGSCLIFFDMAVLECTKVLMNKSKVLLVLFLFHISKSRVPSVIFFLSIVLIVLVHTVLIGQRSGAPGVRRQIWSV